MCGVRSCGCVALVVGCGVARLLDCCVALLSGCGVALLPARPVDLRARGEGVVQYSGKVACPSGRRCSTRNAVWCHSHPGFKSQRYRHCRPAPLGPGGFVMPEWVCLRVSAACCCLWPHGCFGRRRPRPLCVPVGGGPPASRPRRELRSARRLEARPGPATAHRHRGRSLRRPPHQWCLIADVWLCASSRSQARPRHRPPAPQPGPPIPAAPSTPAAPTLLRCGLVRRLEARPGLASRSTLYPQFRMQFPNACSLQLCEKPGISTITFQSMKYARGNCMRNLSGADLAAAFGCWGRTLRPFRCSSSQRRWGFCSIRSWLSACRRRVAPLMTPFPPFGGSVSVAGGGVAPKVQTASAKNAHNGRLWMRWSAFWAQQCLAGGACSQVKPLFRA